VAARAGGLHREEALAVDHLALAVAGLAGLRLGAGRRAAAVAVLAGVAARDGDLALDAGDRLRERDHDPGLEVGAALRAAAPALPPRLPNRSPNRSPKRLKISSVPWKPLKPAARRALVAVLVVELALAVVAQHLERLGRLLEALLGLLVARVAVRVVLHRHLAVGLLDVRCGCAALDAQNLVIVAFCGHRAREAKHRAPDCQRRRQKPCRSTRGRDRPSVW
jgi:hypothetical protein